MKIDKKWIYLLVICFFFLYFLDVFLTYLAVHNFKIAYETNSFTTFLWEKFGYLQGELIHFSIFLVVIFGFLFISKSKLGADFSFFCLICLCLLWLSVIFHNTTVLIESIK